MGAKHLALGLVLPLLLWPRAASSADISFATPEGGTANLHVISYAEIPFQTVIHQQYDYSCGSAALATLLTFHYGVRTSEAELFKAMYAAGDQARIQKLGFSLLDMKRYLVAHGFQADGYQLGLNDLVAAATPAIALIQVGSYRHFVVIKGIASGRILVGDPSQGLHVYIATDFAKLWNGVVFMIHPSSGAPGIFNSASEWRRWANFHPLQAATLNMPLEPFLRDLRVLYQIRPNQVIPPSASGQ
jgi:predicted double-glycine peptidase